MPLPDSDTRCLGKDCPIKNSCRRHLTIEIDKKALPTNGHIILRAYAVSFSGKSEKCIGYVAPDNPRRAQVYEYKQVELFEFQ
jgi:hypothetical protein